MTTTTTNPMGPEVSEFERSLTSLLRLSDSLNSLFDLERLLEVLVEQVLTITDAESGCAGLRSPKGMSCGMFLRGWVLLHGTHYFTNQAANDAVIIPEIRDRFGVRAGMCIPILDGKREVIAFFEVYNKKSGDEFTERDLQNSVAAAKIASLAIQNGLTHRNLIALGVFSRALTLAADLEQILEVAAQHIEINFHRGAAILLPSDGALILRLQTPEFPSSDGEREAANGCWKNGQETGAGTNAPGSARAHYLALKVRGQVLGVLGILAVPDEWFSARQRDLLDAFIGQSALAIERGILDQRLRRLRFLDESDRLQNALLAAISHEVRASLASITAAVSGMLHPLAPLDEGHERQLLQTAESEARRLHRLMNNQLNVTRLQAGVSQVTVEPCDLLDVIGPALEELGTASEHRPVSIELTPDLPLVPMNFELIKQVLVNLISNAFKFSSAHQPVRVSGRIVNEELEVLVADRGRGVPDEDLERVFEKFHRLSEPRSVDGLGLGLSICREFVEAHRGRIQLENDPGGETIARLFLPANVSSSF